LPSVESLEERTLLTTPAVITWPQPAPITYGNALSALQLDATADVPGVMTYTPPLGTILGAGNYQTLSATFTPSDTVNYSPTTSTVPIDVKPAPLSITGLTAHDKVYDGTTTAAIATTGAALSGLLQGDDIALSATPSIFYSGVDRAPSPSTRTAWCMSPMNGPLR
jgi:hypothetical protein